MTRIKTPHRPEFGNSLPRSTHRLSTRVIQICGDSMWTTLCTNRGKPGDKQWITWENSGIIHIPPVPVHTGHTAPVDKKWAVNWENSVSHRIHRPYYYDVLISE
jgi:hypothetical protein